MHRIKKSWWLHYVGYLACMAVIFTWPTAYFASIGFLLTTLVVFVEDLQDQIDKNNETK